MCLVDEHDVHIPTMTVRDTLAFAYKCNSTHFKAAHVSTILEILGLQHVADTVVGGEGVRGVSGGERRRVTVGEQWAANVRVFLADRLTDGLDSKAALDLIRALHVWCRTTDATVVLSLLQPPPEVYQYFDNVCILQDGLMGFLFSGPLCQVLCLLVCALFLLSLLTFVQWSTAQKSIAIVRNAGFHGRIHRPLLVSLNSSKHLSKNCSSISGT